MKTASLIARLLLSLIFLVFGLNGFLHFIPMPPPTGVAGQYFGAIFFVVERSTVSLEFAYRAIAVHTYNQDISERSSSFQVSNVTNVQQIETSIGYDNSFSSRAHGSGALRQFVERYYFVGHLTIKFSVCGII